MPRSWNSSNASTTSIDWQYEIGTMAWSQFCGHIRFWTMKGVSELWNGSTMCPLVLNADSDATMEIGTANTLLATLDNTWYLLELPFHHSNISKFTSFLALQCSSKYLTTSLLQPIDCLASKKRSYQEWTITYGSLASPLVYVLSLLLDSCTFGEWIEE